MVGCPKIALLKSTPFCRNEATKKVEPPERVLLLKNLLIVSRKLSEWKRAIDKSTVDTFNNGISQCRINDKTRERFA